jgi:hypothetical protein
MRPTYAKQNGMLVLTTPAIVQALYAHYRERGYLCLDELKPGTGAYSYNGGIDFWCMHEWPSKKHVRISFEVKVSRGDFRKEKLNPHKQKNALAYSNEFYFVTPPKLVSTYELPEYAGLIEVRVDGTLRTVKAAPWRDSEPPSWNFMAAVMRRLVRMRIDPVSAVTEPMV